MTRRTKLLCLLFAICSWAPLAGCLRADRGLSYEPPAGDSVRIIRVTNLESGAVGHFQIETIGPGWWGDK